MAQSLADYVRQAISTVTGKVNQLQQQLAALKQQNELLGKIVAQQPRSITQEIDKIQGRRIFFNLTGRVAFTLADNGRRGQPVLFQVSQDGPFVMTHYPFAIWLPTAPATATLFGLWRPVSAWPLPDQASGGAVPEDLDEDIISISYELIDSGSQRNFQNEAAPPILSRPDNMVPLPVPTLFTPNAAMQFTPTYERILFNNQGVPPTEGNLVVCLPGYRIVNM